MAVYHGFASEGLIRGVPSRYGGGQTRKPAGLLLSGGAQRPTE